MPRFPKQVKYSPKYSDDLYEYCHVILPMTIYERMPTGRLLTESEWKSLGIQQDRNWVHYFIHEPEPHVLLFRRFHEKRISLVSPQMVTFVEGEFIYISS